MEDPAIARSTMSRQEESELQTRLQRLRDALEKIAVGYPCETVDDMQRVARDALGRPEVVYTAPWNIDPPI